VLKGKFDSSSEDEKNDKAGELRNIDIRMAENGYTMECSYEPEKCGECGERKTTVHNTATALLKHLGQILQ